MAETKIKAAQFHGVIGHGTDGYFLMTNGDGTMAWAEGGATGPSVTSVSYPGDDLAADPAGGQTVVLTGTNFGSSMTVSIGGTTAPSVAHDSSTQLTITTPAKAAGDYDIVVTNTVTGASGTFVNGISYNGVPTWTTAAGSLGTFESETTISTITLQATEPDGGTITFNITNGALPTGLSLTGANIDGTTTAESSTTLYSFTIEAIDDENQATPRNFSITVNSAAIISSENFTINTYTGNGSTQSIEGKIGTAADFNGSSSYISSSNPFSGQSGDGQIYSVSIWFKADSFSSQYPTLFKGRGTGETPPYVWLTASKIRFHGYKYGDATVSLNTNQWYHLVVIENNGVISGYLDGTSITFSNQLIWNQTNGANLFIGGDPNSSSYYWDGKIDQVRIFNKALSSSEITTLYGENNASSTKSTTDIFDDGSGVALYEFEEGAKNTGAKKHYLHVSDAGGQNTSVRINSVDSEFTYARPTGYAEWGGSFDPNNTATDYVGSSSGFVFSESNKKWDKPTSNYFHSVWSTNGYSSGKYYVELEFLNADLIFGLSTSETADTVHSGASFYENAISYFSYTANKRVYSNTSVSGGAVLATNNVIGFAVDFDNTTLKYYINNTLVETETLAGYDGTPTNVSFVGTSFQPDLVWIKNRDSSIANHYLIDSVRGIGSSTYKFISSDLTTAENTTTTSHVNSIDSNGFTVQASHIRTNANGDDYVAWSWKSGGTAVSNTNGSDTTSVSANQDAGFSIVSLSKTDTNTRTYGHGLSSAPEMIILKKTASADDWLVYHKDLGNTVRISLNSTAAKVTGTGVWGSTTPTSSVFTLQNQNGGAHIAYCFHSVDGYQKIGSYTGNNPTASTIRDIDVGFTPRFVLLKNASTLGPGWNMYDNLRGSNNIFANSSNAEADYSSVFEIINNGFRLKSINTNTNYQTDTFIYLAIA